MTQVNRVDTTPEKTLELFRKGFKKIQETIPEATLEDMAIGFAKSFSETVLEKTTPEDKETAMAGIFLALFIANERNRKYEISVWMKQAVELYKADGVDQTFAEYENLIP